jgi:hypothetical protein
MSEETKAVISLDQHRKQTKADEIKAERQRLREELMRAIPQAPSPEQVAAVYSMLADAAATRTPEKK